jgi:predicted DNA-binding transcriptional regulator AlpA
MSPPNEPSPVLLSVAEFCRVHSLSHSYFYKLRKQGRAPPSFTIGRKRLISADAAEVWRQSLMERPER